jgi:hypothetical protein
MISRRKFLGVTVGAGASLLDPESRADKAWPRCTEKRALCGLADLQGSYLQRESFVGFRAALAGLGARPVVWTSDSPRHSHFIIVPAATTLDEVLARGLSIAMHDGASVLLESAAGFRAGENFEAARQTLLKHWGMAVGSPVILRGDGKSQGMAPYVDFSWPVAVKVRDFSRVVPVCAREDETIARVRGLRVGAKRKIAAGTLIFLGSLIGPSLGAGDREAQRWLGEVLRSAEG